MANRYFNVLTRATEDGVNKLVSTASGIYRGMLAGWPSGGSLDASTGSDPYGMFHDYLRLEEHPTNEALESYLAGKEINVATGKFICMVGPDLFTAGSVASVGDDLYPGTASLLDTAQNWPGVAKIGTVLSHHTVADAGGSGSFTAARCIMDFPVL